MADLHRGFVPIDLDRPRQLRFTMRETWLLVQQYGDGFLGALYERAPGKTFGIALKDPDVMVGFLLIGLQADAEAHGETLTREQVEAMVTPTRFLATFTALVMALTGTHSVPAGNESAGGAKVEAAGEAAKPPASTSGKRKDGPRRSSASLRKRSGR